MSALFFKKKSGRGTIPIQRVKELSSHGFAETEIIDILRKEGYSPEEIDHALSEAMKEKIEKGGDTKEKGKSEEGKKELLPSIDDLSPQNENLLEETSTTTDQNYYQYTMEDYINYIDSLVQSRMSEVSEKIVQISSKYKELENKITALDHSIREMMKSKYSEQREILNKIESFRESLEDISSRVGGLERAFKETLPALIESVRALSDLVHQLKREA